MRYFLIQKLVRDKIVSSMEESGQKPVGVRVLSDEEFRQELIVKLIEESQELSKAKKLSEFREELADVITIVDYLKKSLKLTPKKIENLIKEKEVDRGGFGKKVYLNKVGTSGNDRWTKYFLKYPDKYPETSK